MNKLTRRLASLHITRATIFKIFLLLGIVIISAVFIWYTFGVIDVLQEDTRSQVQKYVKLWQLAANSPAPSRELQFIFDEIIVKANFPIIVLDGDRNPIHWRNIEGIEPGDTSSAARQYLKQRAEEMVETNGEFPLYFGETHVNYLCYGDSEIINQLKRMPFIEIGIVLAFLIVGAIGFQNIRKSEERHIWVGMAKETAHQLGTPISSLLGWLEVLDSERTERERELPREHAGLLQETTSNMKIDVNRLQRVANRFGLIGSVPELTPTDPNDVLCETVEYFRRRLPFEGRGITIEYERTDLPELLLNVELFGWAMENMIKNALQSVDSRSGRITIEAYTSDARDEVTICIIDNGKGISSAAARKIFRAGFTTKKRGWGLGLTLSRRIVEEYHGGRLSLKRSRPGETVFEIVLPVRKT